MENAQPLKIKDLCIAHNGTIANAEELSGMVGGCTFTPQTMSDTLVATQRLLTHLQVKGNIVEAMGILKDEMVGSFCFTFLFYWRSIRFCSVIAEDFDHWYWDIYLNQTLTWLHQNHAR